MISVEWNASAEEFLVIASINFRNHVVSRVIYTIYLNYM